MTLPVPYFDDGQITIYCGDCREILPLIEPDSVDLVLTDPPYQSLDVEVKIGSTTRLVGLDQLGGKRLASSNGKRWFETVPAGELGEILHSCRRILRATGALYVFGDVKSGLEFFPALQPANVLVWDKLSIGMGYNWRRMHEWIAYCPMPKHQLRDASAGDILRVRGVIEKCHPTEKPIGVLQRILLNSTEVNCLVLDPFMGTGSAARACKDLDRHFIGIEVREDYCEIAVRRLRQSVLALEGM